MMIGSVVLSQPTPGANGGLRSEQLQPALPAAPANAVPADAAPSTNTTFKIRCGACKCISMMKPVSQRASGYRSVEGGTIEEREFTFCCKCGRTIMKTFPVFIEEDKVVPVPDGAAIKEKLHQAIERAKK